MFLSNFNFNLSLHVGSLIKKKKVSCSIPLSLCHVYDLFIAVQSFYVVSNETIYIYSFGISHLKKSPFSLQCFIFSTEYPFHKNLVSHSCKILRFLFIHSKCVFFFSPFQQLRKHRTPNQI